VKSPAQFFGVENTSRTPRGINIPENNAHVIKNLLGKKMRIKEVRNSTAVIGVMILERSLYSPLHTVC